MIIDFHTHTYPDKIASLVIRKLTGSITTSAYTKGTITALEESATKAGIDKCVVLPVVTNPRQAESINRVAVETNMRNSSLISFGGIHPDNSDYRRIFSTLAAEGIKGIKLHPIFQNTYFDDIKYMRLIDCACEYGFIISVHAGRDVNDRTLDYVTVPHVKNLLMTVKPNKLILAHMGGHLCWDEAEDMLKDYRSVAPNDAHLYLDTAFCLPSTVASQNAPDIDYLTNERFKRMVSIMGADHVLFGTDSPWTDQAPAIEAIKASGLSKKEISLILGDNARKLLEL